MPAGYTSGQVSVLDTITRTCRNAAGDIIATQVITVQAYTNTGVNSAGMSLVTSDGLSTNRFKRTAVVKLSTTKSPRSGASSTIANIQTEGKYDSRTEDGGDITTVTYAGRAPVNDVVVPVTTLGGVLKVGDSV
jgi:hypothetical protein